MAAEWIDLISARSVAVTAVCRRRFIEQQGGVRLTTPQCMLPLTKLRRAVHTRQLGYWILRPLCQVTYSPTMDWQWSWRKKMPFNVARFVVWRFCLFCSTEAVLAGSSIWCRQSLLYVSEEIKAGLFWSDSVNRNRRTKSKTKLGKHTYLCLL